MGPVDYNVARAAEVEAEEASLLRRFGRTSHGGAGTAARPMSRPLDETRKTTIHEGRLHVPLKTRLGKLLSKTALRKTPLRRHDESLVFAREAADLRMLLGLEEDGMGKRKGTVRVDKEKLLTTIPPGGATAASLAEVLDCTTETVRLKLRELKAAGRVVSESRGAKGQRGGRAPTVWYCKGDRPDAGRKASPRAPRPAGAKATSVAPLKLTGQTKDEITTGDCLELDDLLTPLREQLEKFIERRAKARALNMLKQLLDDALAARVEDDDAE
jgi:hypothetical protein